MADFPFDAVLFDCDGVLVDSEPITNRVLTEMLELVRAREIFGQRKAAWSKWHNQILEWKRERSAHLSLWERSARSAG